jgi:hypothetical protein
MIDYPLEPGQRMLVRTNSFGPYSEYSHMLVTFHKVTSTNSGIMTICHYVDDFHKVHEISIPLFLLWRIADEENLLEMHENYIHSQNLIKS